MSNEEPKPIPNNVPNDQPERVERKDNQRVDNDTKSIELGESYGYNKLPDEPPPTQLRADPIPQTAQGDASTSDSTSAPTSSGGETSQSQDA